MNSYEYELIIDKLERIENQRVPQLMTMQETADCLSISLRTLSSLILEDDFAPLIKIGRQNRFKASDIANYIERMSTNNKNK